MRNILCVSVVCCILFVPGCGKSAPGTAPAKNRKSVNATAPIKLEPIFRPRADRDAESKKKYPPLIAFYDDFGTNKFGFLNALGQVAIEPKYTSAIDFHEGRALVWEGENALQIDQEDRIVRRIPRICYDAEYSEGRYWRRAASKKFGLRDEDGKELLPPTFDNVAPFSDERSAVNLGAKESSGRHGGSFLLGGKWGFVDLSGKLVIPTIYDRADLFSEGLASVLKGDRWQFIDKSGKMVFQIEKGVPGDFQEGVTAVVIHLEENRSTYRTRYLDKAGKLIFEIDGKGESFSEGLAQIQIVGEDKSRSQYGFVNRQGEMVIKPAFYDSLPFKEGLAPVKVTIPKADEPDGSARWAYVDHSGIVVIKPIYDQAMPFTNGVARVHVGGTTYCWPSEASGLPPIYRWRDGEWWLIDKQGKQLAILERLGDAVKK